MTTLPLEICKQIAQTRREKGLTQSALAQEVGCKQSAISMLEAGQPSKLSKENIEKIASALGLTLQTAQTKLVSSCGEKKGFCPNAQCPSNTPYVVQGQLVFQPRLQQEKHCAYCAELLETCCPTCATAIHVEGAYCTSCGTARVTNTLPADLPIAAWIVERRRELLEFRRLTTVSSTEME
jgi:transcriptional regulator with XRE-family HTH domain